MNSVDFGRAFTYVFEDKDWIKKVLIGGLMVPLIIVFFIGAFILNGYMLEIVRRVASGNDTPLPEWDDFGGYLSRGFILTVGLLIWYIPYIILACCLGLGLGLSDSSDMGGANIGGNLFLNGVGLIYSAVIMPVVIGAFATDMQFGSMFQFNRIMEAVQRIGAGFVMVFLILLVANIIAGLGLIAFCIGVFFTIAYSIFVSGHAYGQVSRIGYGAGTTTTTPTDRPAF